MRVAVIGGGITGLAAAHALARDGDQQVTLLERDSRLGGKIFTENRSGVTFEAGADAFIARDPAILQLCDDLQLSAHLTAPDVFGAHIWSGGRLIQVPPDWVFGLPTTASALASSDLLSLRGKLRAIWDLVAPGKLTGEDISVGKLIRTRLGGELVEGVVDPVLAGSRAGIVDDISLAAGLAPLDAVARRSASIVRGLGAARHRGELPEGPPPFRGFPGGMGLLVERLRGALGNVRVRTSTPASRIVPSEKGYVVELADGEPLATDGIVLAAPAFAAAQLLEDLSPEAARQLYRIQYASVAVAVLVYEAGAGSIPPSGSGFLVPSRDHRALSACTWYSKKWRRAAPEDGRLVVRCFVGRAGRHASLSLDDEHLIGEIDAEVREALDFKGAVQSSRVYRWERGLPQYRVGHLNLLERIQSAMAVHPGIALAGAGYHGSGLPDCVRQGQQAAAQVVNFLMARRG